MILIITHKDDYTADYVVDILNKRNIQYTRLNCEDILNGDFLIDDSINFRVNKYTAFKSVWFRRTKLPQFPKFTIQEQEFLLSEYDSFLKNIFAITQSKRWLSQPDSIYRAENKLLQLRYAQSIGLNVPKTLISTDPQQIRNFYYLNKERIILKPFSSSKLSDDHATKLLFTNLVKKEHIDRIEDFELTPVIFQEYIDKEIEHRITVVDKEIFIASVDSQKNVKTKIDWRRDNLTFYQDSLPIKIKNKCLEIVHKLGLKFGAIDMIKDIHGNYYFIEINPNGQWVWIETDTGLKISDSIVKYLSE